MSQNSDKLRLVLDQVEKTAAAGQLPIVVFDLDDTLFSTAARNLRIIREFAADNEETYPDFAGAASKLGLSDMGWDNGQALCENGLTKKDPSLKAYAACWRNRFFKNEYVALDLPVPGAREFTQACFDAGALIYYLTGRSVGPLELTVGDGADKHTETVTRGMEIGTVEALTARGFPYWSGRCELHLKSDPAQSDDDFKDQANRTVKSLNGNVIAAFDNEPANVRVFQRDFPEAMHFWLKTSWDPTDPVPDDKAIVLTDFERVAAPTKAIKSTNDTNTLQALNDQKGEPVDWWFLYKLPDNVGSPKTTGDEYLYYDAESKVPPALSPHTLDKEGGALASTLDNLFKGGSNVGWVLYNDEVPEGDHNDGAKGHCKGVLAFDKTNDRGLLLIHSTPRFPARGGTTLPDKEKIYGQTFLCITLKDYATAGVLAEQLRLQQDPQVYDHQLPPGIQDDDPIARFARGDNLPVPEDPEHVRFESRGGTSFTLIAKNRVWGGDFWIDLVAPILEVDMKVESWRRGTMPAEDKPTDPEHIDDIQYIDLSSLGLEGYEWHYTKDHAKWGISEEAKHPWVCVGDINRMVSQEKRGGGTAAFLDEQLWKALDGIELLKKDSDK